MMRVKFYILKVCFVSTALKGGKFFAPCSCNVEACGCVGERIKITKPDKVNFDSYQNDKTGLSKLPKGKIEGSIYIKFLDAYYNLLFPHSTNQYCFSIKINNVLVTYRDQIKDV